MKKNAVTERLKHTLGSLKNALAFAADGNKDHLIKLKAAEALIQEVQGELKAQLEKAAAR